MLKFLSCNFIEFFNSNKYSICDLALSRLRSRYKQIIFLHISSFASLFFFCNVLDRILVLWNRIGESLCFLPLLSASSFSHMLLYPNNFSVILVCFMLPNSFYLLKWMCNRYSTFYLFIGSFEADLHYYLWLLLVSRLSWLLPPQCLDSMFKWPCWILLTTFDTLTYVCMLWWQGCISVNHGIWSL